MSCRVVSYLAVLPSALVRVPTGERLSPLLQLLIITHGACMGGVKPQGKVAAKFFQPRSAWAVLMGYERIGHVLRGLEHCHCDGDGDWTGGCGSWLPVTQIYPD